jgi:flagellar M-ring protein FliF
VAEALARALGNGTSFWSGLTRAQQMLLVAVAVLLPIVVFAGSQWLGDGQYVPLFASLSAEDAGTLMAHLKATKTPYRIGGTGDQILVPADRVNEVRLRVATQGLPLGGGVGFEMFDKPSLGISDFAQRLNHQRALQAELARTIGQLRGVTRARVHLVLPQPSLFTERDRPASASVFLKLAPGAKLGAEQVRGIVHLVASSVEGLTVDHVTVVDTAGRVLSAGADTAGGALSPRRLEIKAAVEEGIERRLQSLLDAALGPGQALARVAAQVNFDQVERTEERFENPVARQETRTVETTKGSSSTPPPLASVNPGTPPPGASTTSNDGTRESETISYEIGKIVARTLTTPGDIQRLSVAVLLNSGPKPNPSGKGDARPAAPRSPEDLEKIRRIVMGAVGFNQARGDEVSVVELPFDTAMVERERTLLEQPESAAPTSFGVDLGGVRQVVAVAVLLAAGVAVFFWLGRRQRRQRTLQEFERLLDRPETADAVRTAVTPSVGGASPEAVTAGPSGPLIPEEVLRQTKQRENIRQQVLSLANTEPEATAQLLRAWLVRRAGAVMRDGG